MRSQRWDPVSIFHKRNHCSAPDSNLAMQSSFRSCKRPGTINLLLTVGTDNLLAGTGDHVKSERGRLLHEHGSCPDKQCIVFAHAETPADTNMLSSGERKSLLYWCISSLYVSSVWNDLWLPDRRCDAHIFYFSIRAEHVKTKSAPASVSLGGCCWPCLCLWVRFFPQSKGEASRIGRRLPSQIHNFLRMSVCPSGFH